MYRFNYVDHKTDFIFVPPKDDVLCTPSQIGPPPPEDNDHPYVHHATSALRGDKVLNQDIFLRKIFLI